MDTKNLFQSKMSRKIIFGVGIAVVVLAVFQAGMFVGYRKAAFSYKWGDNYYRTFGGRHRGEMGGMMGLFRGKDFSSSHGTIGKIISIDLPTLAIEDKDGVEKIILITDDTVIKKFRGNIQPADIKIDDSVTVIGSPNADAQIEAKFIRLLPEFSITH